MKIRTQNGFWGSAAIAAAVAMLFAFMLMARVQGRADVAPTGAEAFPWGAYVALLAVILAIFLWPAAKNFITVYAAALRAGRPPEPSPRSDMARRSHRAASICPPSRAISDRRDAH